jgi:ribonuclease HI
MREWVSGWAARGWRRKDGPIENVELWRDLVASARLHEVQWTWVRGHRGHPKNEYANDLAVLAAREQLTSTGLVASGFDEWLAGKMARGLFADYDRDADFVALERKLLAGEAVPLAL